jgi:acyl carrier protein
MMEFDDFAAWLADRARLADGGVQLTRDARFDELGLDSLQFVELWIASEDLGMDLPEELFFSLDTVGDFFYYYETKSAHA